MGGRVWMCACLLRWLVVVLRAVCSLFSEAFRFVSILVVVYLIVLAHWVS